MDYTAEVQTKLARVRAIMEQQQIGAVWLRTVSNVSWITGGVDVAVNTADSVGIASVVITADSATVVTNAIEAPRLNDEDGIEARGFALEVSPWEAPVPVNFGSTLGTDVPLEGAKDISREIVIARSKLLPVEIERFRVLGGICAAGMQRAINRITPGHNEYAIAAALEYETYSRGARPVVVLVATDERIYKVRHPLPTGKVMDKYAMLVLCARTGGLTCSVTRLVHFGALPDDLKRKQQACAEVDAAIIAASQPGRTLDELFGVLQTAYADAGYDGEWKLHHQGGIAGYDPRELIAVPGETVALEAGMVCAWNPSITGTKCEDTILVTDGAAEVLTPIAGWPSVAVEVSGQTIARPLIMEVV
ncbi:MAG: M24 family metallopeptidase [Anaerolineae bacterium]|nr:M24 family metallopeptidase [Anaerolineae bacterium]